MPDVQPPTMADSSATRSLSTRHDPGLPSPAPTLTPGSDLPEVDGYQIVRLIGRGGMGIVYEARDLALQRTVALKMILLGSHASEKDRHRFQQEAAAVAQLQHAGIVQIYEIGQSATGPFLSLEYVAGGSLADQLDGKPWLSVTAAKMVEQIAEAVEAAHQLGIVHRDLKPANVLLSAECGARHTDSKSDALKSTGEFAPFRTPNPEFRVPKITDFGLAKRLDSDHGQTASGAILGTPSYMAPEQAEGKSNNVGPATDVYALGSILYELLTGRPPFLAETPFDTIMQVSRQEPVPPTRLNNKVPADLETICLKCLRKEPERRYPTAAALADDLNRYRIGRPILARPVGPLERGWRWCRRNPTVACLLFTVGVLLLAGTGIATFFAYEAEKREKDALLSASAAHASAQEANHATKKAELHLYVAHLNLAQNALRDNRLIRLRGLLRDTADEHRGWEWHFLQRQHEMAQHQLRLPYASSGSTIQAVALAAASGRIAYLLHQDDGISAEPTGYSVAVVEIASGQVVFSHKNPTRLGAAVSLALCGNGHVVALSEGDSLRVWNVDEQKEIAKLTADPKAESRCLALDTAGKLIALAEGRNLQFIQVDSGQTLHRVSLTPVGSLVPQMQFDLAGSTLYFSRITPPSASGQSLEVFACDIATEAIRSVSGPLPVEGTAPPFARSADGRSLVMPTGRGLAVWDTRSRKQTKIIPGAVETVSAISVTTDGRFVAIGGANGLLTLYDAQDEAAAPIHMRGHDGPPIAVAFLGFDRVCSIDAKGDMRLWERTRKEIVHLPGRSGALAGSTSQPLFDCPGRFVAQIVTTPQVTAGLSNCEVLVWDTTINRLHKRLSLGIVPSIAGLPAATRGRLAMSDDGALMAYVLYRQEEGFDAFRLAAGLLPRVALRIGGSGGTGNLSREVVEATVRAFIPEMETILLRRLDQSKNHASIALTEPAQQLLLSPGGRHLLVAGNGWQLHETGAGEQVMGEAKEGEFMTRACFHPEGTRFVVARSRLADAGVASIQWRSVADSNKVIQIPLASGEERLKIESVRFSPTGRYLAAFAIDSCQRRKSTRGTSDRLIVWKVEQDDSVRRLWSTSLGSNSSWHLTEMWPLDFDEANDRIVVASELPEQLAKVRVLKLESGDTLHTFHVQANGVHFTAITADGRRLLVAGGSAPGADAHSAELHVFDLVSGQELLELPLGNVISCQGMPTTTYHFDGHKLRIAGWNEKTGEFRLLDGSPVGK